MLCPYCLKNTSESTCKGCNESLPPLYIKNARNPAIFSAVGFSGHGKTVYLAALMHAMEKQLTQIWPKFYRQGLDVEAVKRVIENLQLLRHGDLPESTRRNFPRPSIHRLAEMPKFGSRTLLIYDPPGEAFDSDEGIERFAHFTQHSPVVVFLVSLNDLQNPEEEDLYRLLNTYVLGMARMGARTKNQHLIVTYTKADLLTEKLQGYPAVLGHLGNANLAEMANPKPYLNTLKVLSDQLAAFTENDFEARNFMRLARKEFKSLAFCAVSALGTPPEDGRLSTVIEPRRVADPLLWVLNES
jgi:hypothetical protein